MYVMEILFCSGERGLMPMKVDRKAAHDLWAERADELLLGKALGIRVEGNPQGHPVRVGLFVVSELDPNDKGTLDLEVYRSCSDLHETVEKPSTLLIPKGAVV